MKQERLKVLELLADGKISADDAGLLLDKLSQPEAPHFVSDETAEQVEEKLQRFAKSCESFAREFSQKAANAYRDVEPKLKKAGQAILEKTAAIVDDISTSLHESLDRSKAEKCCGDTCGDDSCCGDKTDDEPKPN